MKAYIICGSHRAYDYVASIVKRPLQNYYDSDFDKNYQITEIPANKLTECLGIKSVRLAKFDANKWHKCWH